MVVGGWGGGGCGGEGRGGGGGGGWVGVVWGGGGGGGGKRERVKIMHNFDDMYQHIVCFALTFFRFMPYFDTPVSFYWFRLRPFQTLKTQLIRVNVFHLCHVLYKT